MTTPLLETQFVKLGNGRRLRLARLGSGPPLVLLHGYPENLQIWSHLAPLLARHYQVIAFDWPGQGYSEEWPGGATPQLLADRLLTILDELHIPRPVIVGSDMGGQPALVFAARYPTRLSRLVVMNSLVFGDEPTSWEIRWLRQLGFNRLALRYLPGVIFRRARATFLPRGVTLETHLRDHFWSAFHRLAVRRFISKMCAGYQGTLPRLPELYAQITCPTLVLWAERDKHFPVRQAIRLHDTIATSKLEIVPHATHWMVLDRAVELAQLIVDHAHSRHP